MAAGKRTLNDITYELFDINPAEFYKARFLYPPLNPAQEDPIIKMSLSYQKINHLVRAIRQHAGAGPLKILEVGCGAGPIGARVKYYCPECRLYGVDLDEASVAVARQNGFDEAIACDVFRGLPYPDESFDFVFTMDFWGHIEFARKDHILRECLRVTKKGGHGWHGIEAAAVDYCGCNPKDPEDPIRKYVYMEGHIGVETLEHNVERFSRCFEVLAALPWPIRPFLDIENAITYKGFGEAFSKAISPFDDTNARLCSNLVMGHCSEYILDRLVESFGPVLTRDVFEKLGPDAARFADLFVQGAGFAMLTVKRAGAATR
jgi:ubiquinone/menaquinone biosynthesis C-methylase UbiE